MMQLYFIRHGQSEANLLHEISNRGWKHPLTELGFQQARSLAQSMQGIQLARVFSSPVMRAVQTAEIAAAAAGVPVEVTDALREYDLGVLEGRSDEEAWRLYDEEVAAWLDRRDWDFRVPEGESFNDIRARFEPFIQGLAAQYGQSEAGLALVGHGGTYRLMLPLVLKNIDFDFALAHPITNTMIITACAAGSGLRCQRWGDLVLE